MPPPSALVVLLGALLATSAAGQNLCQRRVASLRALAADAKQHRLNPSLVLSGDTAEALLDQFKRMGAERSKRPARATVVYEEGAFVVRRPEQLVALAKVTPVELCLGQSGLPPRTWSREADPKLVAPLLDGLRPVAQDDRATWLFRRLGATRCQPLHEQLERLGHAAPQDRLELLAAGAAAALEACGCPDDEADRVLAHITLMAEVWEPTRICAPLDVSPTAGAPGLELNTVKLQELLQRAQASGGAVHLTVRPEGTKPKTAARPAHDVQPTVKGSLDPQLVAKVVRAHQPQIRSCYESALAKKVKASGAISLQFTISPEGTVSQARVLHGKAGSAELNACLVDRVQSWRFPRHPGPGGVVVTVPLASDSQ